MAAHALEEVCPLRIAQQNLAKGRANTVAFGVYVRRSKYYYSMSALLSGCVCVKAWSNSSSITHSLVTRSPVKTCRINSPKFTFYIKCLLTILVYVDSMSIWGAKSSRHPSDARTIHVRVCGLRFCCCVFGSPGHNNNFVRVYS